MRNPARIAIRPAFAAALCLIAAGAPVSATPDSVDVRFRYRPSGSPGSVYLAGEFNRWAENRGGRITDPRFAMTRGADGVWTAVARLAVGGPTPLPDPGRSLAGFYQYKFNENGSPDGWKPDPLNPRRNALDNGNSLVRAADPVIFILQPNAFSGLVLSPRPEISAGVFPALRSVLDTSAFRIEIDGRPAVPAGRLYDPASRTLRWVPDADLPNGVHTVILAARCAGGARVADTASFTVSAGAVRFLTRPDTACLRAVKDLAGAVDDPSVTRVVVTRNGAAAEASLSAGRFSASLPLEEGLNRIAAEGFRADGTSAGSDSLRITRRANHAPAPSVRTRLAGTSVILSAAGNDPDGDPVSFSWTSDDAFNPAALGLRGSDSTLVVPVPAEPGDYCFDVRAWDPGGLEGAARACFTAGRGGTAAPWGRNTAPGWARDAVVYEIFLPSFTEQGTLAAAAAELPRVRALGAGAVWLMPLHPNGETVNELNAGYNVTDFRGVHPQFGTMADLRRFLETARALGLRVLLDSTPNHVSERHPWVGEVALYGEHAASAPLVERRILGDSRGLGQTPVPDAAHTVYVRYDGWTLANLNYGSPETRSAMLDMYKWWLVDVGADGFRMDVYWGPQNRYGTAAWWGPFRDEIRRVKPEALILGETDGTGPGTEANYADGGGACDAAYDWHFFNQARDALGGGDVDALDARVRNYSPVAAVTHHTGPNALYFRFLENHDETRLASRFPPEAGGRAAAALLFTVPGLPLVYAGQEAGETDRRGRIRWDRPGAGDLTAWYRRLIGVRNRWAAFRSDELVRVPSGRPGVYAFCRPGPDVVAVAAVNFRADEAPVRLDLRGLPAAASGDSIGGPGPAFLNDVLNDTSYALAAGGLDAFRFRLPPWGAAVLVLADTAFRFDDAPPPGPPPGGRLGMDPNRPNPFRASTSLAYRVRNDGLDTVRLSVVDARGRTVRVLSDGRRPTGAYTAEWDGRDAAGRPAASGVYLFRLSLGRETRTVKGLLVR